MRPTISPAMNTESTHEDQHAVEPGADAAEDHLAELDVDQRHQAAERREAVVHGVDRAARGVGGDGREERRVGDAEADLLALHVAERLVDRQPGEARRCRCASAQ